MDLRTLLKATNAWSHHADQDTYVARTKANEHAAPWPQNSNIVFRQGDLDAIDPRLAPVIRDRTKNKTAPPKIHKVLTHSAHLWLHARVLVNKSGNTHYWEKWLGIHARQRNDKPGRLIITASCYSKVFTTEDGVLYSPSGREVRDLHVYINEVETQHPGFTNAYTIAEALGASPKDTAKMCLQLLQYIDLDATPDVELPGDLSLDM